MNCIDLKGQPLDLSLCFCSGQAFGWEKDGEYWQGVIKERFFRLRVHEGGLQWEGCPNKDDNEALLREYLRLDEDILSVYAALEYGDGRLSDTIRRYYGLRVLRQPLEETFFSFMASSCNNIARITAGLRELRELCGNAVCTRDGRIWKSFPTAEAIAARSTEELTAIKGLAFRGRNMRETALSLPEDFFDTLRILPYEEAKALLTKQKFIGPKLADCICLFALNCTEAVPVDTHIYQIGVREFGTAQAKTIGAKVYSDTADAFRKHYGRYAGWGQQFWFLKEID